MNETYYYTDRVLKNNAMSRTCNFLQRSSVFSLNGRFFSRQYQILHGYHTCLYNILLNYSLPVLKGIYIILKLNNNLK